ncbi:MAG: hypothetical protein Q8P67_11855 [archaeon]|nr:hypothetical protein [archaeon]
MQDTIFENTPPLLPSLDRSTFHGQEPLHVSHFKKERKKKKTERKSGQNSTRDFFFGFGFRIINRRRSLPARASLRGSLRRLKLINAIELPQAKLVNVVCHPIAD